MSLSRYGTKIDSRCYYCLKQIVLNGKDLPKMVNNEWNRIEISVAGENAEVTFRDKTIQVKHARIAQRKKLAKTGLFFRRAVDS